MDRLDSFRKRFTEDMLIRECLHEGSSLRPAKDFDIRRVLLAFTKLDLIKQCISLLNSFKDIEKAEDKNQAWSKFASILISILDNNLAENEVFRDVSTQWKAQYPNFTDHKNENIQVDRELIWKEDNREEKLKEFLNTNINTFKPLEFDVKNAILYTTGIGYFAMSMDLLEATEAINENQGFEENIKKIAAIMIDIFRNKKENLDISNAWNAYIQKMYPDFKAPESVESTQEAVKGELLKQKYGVRGARVELGGKIRVSPDNGPTKMIKIK